MRNPTSAQDALQMAFDRAFITTGAIASAYFAFRIFNQILDLGLTFPPL